MALENSRTITPPPVTVADTVFEYSHAINGLLQDLADRVQQMRQSGRLSPDVLQGIRKFFRIRNIYNSNAIEGNTLDIGETRLVVEQGFTLTGKSLKDQMETKNLSEALDFLEAFAGDPQLEIGETDIRQIHSLILSGVDDENAGKYRNVQVSISGSPILPPPPESVPSQMGDFSRWFRQISVRKADMPEADPVVIAAAAHSWFVQIHPFVDGNGRTARILMNLILMRYGYPISIITREDRQRYYDALSETEGGDLTPLIGLIVETVSEGLEEWEKAAQEQREREEWTQSIARRLTQPQRIEAVSKYEVWRNAMELLKSYMRQAAQGVNQRTHGMAQVFLRDFGIIEYEKFLTLSQGISAKRTWFFRVDVVRDRDRRAARYLFFFGYPSAALRGNVDVTLHIAREEPEGSYNYIVLGEIGRPNVSELVEIGYLPEKEKLLTRGLSGATLEMSMDSVVREFFESVIKHHFPAT